MKNHIKNNLFLFFINPFSHILNFVFSLILIFSFYIFRNFFTSLGSSDLQFFFLYFPLLYIFYVPALISIIHDRNDSFFESCLNDFEIIFSKIISVFIFSLIPIIISLIVPISVSFYGNINFPQIFCAYSGIILYLIFTICFSNYFFTKISNKGLSFLLCVIFLLIFNFLNKMNYYINENSILSFLLNYFSFSWHFNSFSKALISFSDIIFYINFSLAFILFTYFFIKKSRGDFSYENKKLKNISYFTIFLIFLFSQRFNFMIDLNKDKRFSVSDFSKTLISELESDLTITYYLSPELKNLYPEINNVIDYLKNFSSKSKNIFYVQRDASKKETISNLENNGIKGQEIQVNNENTNFVKKVYSAISINYLGQNKIIPFVLGVENLEYNLSNNIQSLLRKTQRQVRVLVGNSLSLSEEYSYVKPFLESNGFSVSEVFLPFSNLLNLSNYDIPLIVLGTSNFTKEDCLDFEEYILTGGSVFLAHQPYEININTDWSLVNESLQFNRSLFTFGCYYNSDLTADLNNFNLTLLAKDENLNTTKEYINYPLWPVLNSQDNALQGMTCFWPASMILDSEVASLIDYSIEPYLYSSDKTWFIKKSGNEFITNPFFVEQSPFESKFCGKQILSSIVKDNKSGKIKLIIFGDQYSFANSMLSYTSKNILDTRSLDFLSDCVLRLNGESELLKIKNKNHFDYSLKKIEKERLFYSKNTVIFVNIFVSLLCNFVLALSFYFVRRRINHD